METDYKKLYEDEVRKGQMLDAYLLARHDLKVKSKPIESELEKQLTTSRQNITNLLTTVDYWVDKCGYLAKQKQKDYLLGLVAGITLGIAITKLIEWTIN
jgi:hypothetical protein